MIGTTCKTQMRTTKRNKYENQDSKAILFSTEFLLEAFKPVLNG